ncbi:hypothetical protein CS542_00590 [Pedobacter sp. IW39]|nr:hypothetical protein CS542_00590 [Pedobacter sp. IW39]
MNTAAAAGVNYRDKLSSGVTASAAYNYGYNKNISEQLNSTETITTDGTILNKSQSSGNSADNT